MQNRPTQTFKLQSEPQVLSDEFPVRWGSPYILSDHEAKTTLHMHNFFEIGYCYEGTGIFVVGEKILPFKQGDIALINSREWHRAQSRKGTSSRWGWLFVDIPRLLRGFPLDVALVDTSRLAGRSFVNVVAREDHPRIHRTIKALVDEMNTPSDQHETRVRGLIIVLLADLHSLPGQTSPTGESSPRHAASIDRVHPALDYIGTHFAEKISIEQLAETCCTSVTNFRRMFSAAMGKSPQEYLLDLRISLAAVDLRETSRSVERVAWDNGFPTLSGFERKFKSSMGASPGAWRKRASASVGVD